MKRKGMGGPVKPRKKPNRGEPPRRGADANDKGEVGKKLPGSGRKGG